MLWSNIPRIAITSVPERDEPDAAEHAEIIAGLAARDPERAEAAVRLHIESAGRTLAAAMRSQP
jgi:DNA-binding GntR family transcriptional regulator